MKKYKQPDYRNLEAAEKVLALPDYGNRDTDGPEAREIIQGLVDYIDDLKSTRVDKDAVRDLIDAADGIISAHDSADAQPFEDEIAELTKATSAAEKAMEG